MAGRGDKGLLITTELIADADTTGLVKDMV